MTYKQRFLSTVTKAKDFLKKMVRQPGSTVYVLTSDKSGDPQLLNLDGIDEFIDAMSMYEAITIIDAFCTTESGQRDPWKQRLATIVNDAYHTIRCFVACYGKLDLCTSLDGVQPMPGLSNDVKLPIYEVSSMEQIRLKATRLFFNNGDLSVVGVDESDRSEKPTEHTHSITELPDLDICGIADHLMFSTE